MTRKVSAAAATFAFIPIPLPPHLRHPSARSRWMVGRSSAFLPLCLIRLCWVSRGQRSLIPASSTSHLPAYLLTCFPFLLLLMLLLPFESWLVSSFLLFVLRCFTFFLCPLGDRSSPFYVSTFSYSVLFFITFIRIFFLLLSFYLLLLFTLVLSLLFCSW